MLEKERSHGKSKKRFAKDSSAPNDNADYSIHIKRLNRVKGQAL